MAVLEPDLGSLLPTSLDRLCLKNTIETQRHREHRDALRSHLVCGISANGHYL